MIAATSAIDLDFLNGPIVPISVGGERWSAADSATRWRRLLAAVATS